MAIFPKAGVGSIEDTAYQHFNPRLKGKVMDYQSTTVKDPVCDMEINPTDAAGGTREYKGKTYYFCALGCKQAFDENPEHYASKRD